MVDRIACDHPSIKTVRASVCRHGGRGRRIELPDGAADVLPKTGTIEVVVNGRTNVGRCRPVASRPALVGLYDTQAAAGGDVEGTNTLTAVLDTLGCGVDTSVLVDVVVDGERLGLRAPGDTAVYNARTQRTSSLDEIARQLED